MKQTLTAILLLGTIGVLGWGIYSFFSITKNLSSAEKGTVVIKSSKYDGINVKTIERRENAGRSLLNVAYPVTENPSINQTVENLSQEFIDSFIETAARQEKSYQEYLAETGTKSHTTVTDYIQHFDVSFANETYVSFIFDRYQNTGGTGINTMFTKVFNRQTGAEIPLKNLFTDAKYLERLSTISRTILYARTKEKALTLDGTEKALADYIKNNKGSIDAGTEPIPENFDGLTIDEKGTLTIYFDKYQVGPGSDGIVSVEIPLKDIADMLAPAVRDIFSIPTPVTRVEKPIQPQTAGSVDCNTAKCVALTFDDGPSIYTATLLDTLKKYSVPATFFVLGRSAQIQPDTIARIVTDGHELGNHTWDHKDLRTLSGDDIDAQLHKTDELLYATVGIRPQYLRPPYGAYNNEVLTHVNRPIILWSVDPEDWKQPPHAELVKRMTSPRTGAIILAHDIHQSTVEAIPEVIVELKRQGFTFVTVGDLLRQPLKAGVTYSHR